MSSVTKDLGHLCSHLPVCLEEIRQPEQVTGERVQGTWIVGDRATLEQRGTVLNHTPSLSLQLPMAVAASASLLLL